MISLILMSQNEREGQVLKMAFEQRGVKVVVSKPTYQNYILTLQYLPDMILLEMPKLCSEQLHYAKIVRKHKRSHAIPIIGYGDATDDMVKKGMFNDGVTYYLERPLTFTAFLGILEQTLRATNKKFTIAPEKNDKEKDIELILNSKAVASQKIEAVIRHVSGLMAFPFTIAKVLKITQDEKSGAVDLSHAIQADPAITTHLLKVSNSVFFASANRRINTIKDAIVRIGFFETKKIVMSMSVMKLFDQRNSNLGFDRVDFWYHSLAVGIIAERIAKFRGDINVEEAFLSGLLHDLGIIIFDEFFPSIFDMTLEQTAKRGGHFIESQNKLIGINHNDVIAGLFPQWKLPQEITEAIVGQYTVNEAAGKEQATAGTKLATCVSMANILAKTLHLGRECDDFIKPIDNSTLQLCRMTAGITKNFIEEIYQNIELFRRFLSLEQREYPREFHGIENPADIRIGVVNPANELFVPPFNYLEKEGIAVEVIKPGTLPSSYDTRFNAILVWAGVNSAIADADAFSHIVKYSPAALAAGERPQFAPVLILGGKDSRIEKECPGNVSFMHNEFDLRNLDKNIVELLAGRKIKPEGMAVAGNAGVMSPDTDEKSIPGLEAVQ